PLLPVIPTLSLHDALPILLLLLFLLMHLGLCSVERHLNRYNKASLKVRCGLEGCGELNCKHSLAYVLLDQNGTIYKTYDFDKRISDLKENPEPSYKKHLKMNIHVNLGCNFYAIIRLSHQFTRWFRSKMILLDKNQLSS